MHGSGVKTDAEGARSTRALSRLHLAHTPLRCDAARTRAAMLLLAGNLFEGEWREGKPMTKDGQGKDENGGPMGWLHEAVANVSSSFGGNSRGEYNQVSTHDDDDDDPRLRGKH